MNIEALEKQLPRWEKWLFVCYGAAFTFLATAIVRAVERVYLSEAFFFAIPAGNEMGVSFIDDPVAMNIQRALIDPWWTLVWVIIQLATLSPGILLAFHSAWRIVPLAKRFNLIFGYFLAAWVVLFSLGVQDPLNASGGYNFLLLGSAIAIGAGYWQLHRKQAGAEEEVFP